MRCQELLFGASILGAAIALNNCRHSRNMRPESARCQPGTPVTIKTDPLSSLRCPGFVFRSLPATPEPAGRTRTSGVPRVSARPTGKAGTQYFKFGRNDSSCRVLESSAIGDLDLRKPSPRPVKPTWRIISIISITSNATTSRSVPAARSALSSLPV
jgi:hypothetical protein